MEPTICYLIRHGAVENPLDLVYGRTRDVPLNVVGQLQIEAVAQKIVARGDQPAAFFVSPQKRTHETATIIARHFPPTPFFDQPELLEVDSRGVVGRSLSWFRGLGNMYDPLLQQKDEYWLEREQSQADRICGVINRATQQFSGQTVILISHGHPLAFGADAWMHPGAPVRSIEALKASDYLLRGQAWRLVISPTGSTMETIG